MTRFIGIIIFFVLTACAPQAEKQKVDLKAEEEAIRSLSMKWLELWNSHDAASMAALFVDNGVAFRKNQEPTVGITAINDLFTRDHKQNPKVVSNWITDRVEISTSGDLAIEYGSWTDTGAGLTGTEEDHGKYVTVYRKINGTWKVSADISVSTKPEEASK
jgi:uncharacterized protein (TIGR02246 family)